MDSDAYIFAYQAHQILGDPLHSETTSESLTQSVLDHYINLRTNKKDSIEHKTKREEYNPIIRKTAAFSEECVIDQFTEV